MAAEARKYNSREHLFEREITDYSKIQEMAKDFLPYSHLWLTTTNWIHNREAWMYGEWFSIDAEECEKFVEDSIKNLNFSIRYFKDKGIQHIQKIAETIKYQIDEFRPKVPLLSALRKNGLRDRHWRQISDKVGFEVYPDADFTFNQALSMNLMKYSDTCIEIGEQATKEFAIEKSLKEMMKVWEGIKFEFTEFKPNLWIIKSFDDVIAAVDDHIATTQSMLFSPFKKPFEEEIMNWFNTLKKISDLIEEWLKLQLNWMYLQPIFESPDIAKQLIRESKNFRSIDNFWKSTMNKCKEIELVLRISQIEELFEKIRDSNISLDNIQKSLNNYLENKRGKFARFYFLSNNELLEILSQAK